jgi:hypothetical protein
MQWSDHEICEECRGSYRQSVTSGEDLCIFWKLACKHRLVKIDKTAHLVRHVVINNEHSFCIFLFVRHQCTSRTAALIQNYHFIGIVRLHLLSLLVGMQIGAFRKMVYSYQIFRMAKVG